MMSRKQKRNLARILIATALLIVVAVVSNVFPMPWWLKLLLYLIPYIVIGYDVLWEAVRNIIHGQVFDENFLMGLATIGRSRWANTLKPFSLCFFIRWRTFPKLCCREEPPLRWPPLMVSGPIRPMWNATAKSLRSIRKKSTWVK